MHAWVSPCICARQPSHVRQLVNELSELDERMSVPVWFMREAIGCGLAGCNGLDSAFARAAIGEETAPDHGYT